MSDITATINLENYPFLKSLQELSRQIVEFRGVIMSLQTAFQGITALGGALGQAFQSGLGLKSAVSGAAEIQDLETSFTTLLGSVDAAKERIADLSEFAVTTPFDLPEVVRASKVLETLTRGALSAGKGLTLVGDIAASTGQPFEEIAMHVGRLYDGLQNGRAVGESMMRLQELGIISGTTRSHIEALQKAGQKGNEVWSIAAEEFGRFAGEMDRRSGTLNGLIQSLGETWQQLSREVGAPLIASLTPVLKDMITNLDGWHNAAENVGSALATAATAIYGITSAATTLMPLLAGIAAAFLVSRIAAMGFAQSINLQNARNQITALSMALRNPREALAALSAIWSSRWAAMTATARAAAAAIRTALMSIGIAAIIQGFAWLQGKTAALNAGTSAKNQVSKEAFKDAKGNLSEIRGVGSEKERTAMAEKLEQKLQAVRDRISSVNDEFGHLDDAGRSGVLESLRGWETSLLNQQRILQGLPAEVMAANAADKARLATLEASWKKTAEIREEIGKLAGEIDRANFDALTPDERKSKLLNDTQTVSTKDLQSEIEFLQRIIDQKEASGAATDEEVRRQKKLIEARREMIKVDKEIADKRKEAEEKARKDAEKKHEEDEKAAKKRAEFLRQFDLETAKIQAELSGDKPGAERIDRQMKTDRYAKEGIDASLTEKEARDRAEKRVSLEEQQEREKRRRERDEDAIRNPKVGHLQSIAGGGGGGGYDPILRESQKQSRELAAQTSLLKKIAEKRTPTQGPATAIFG